MTTATATGNQERIAAHIQDALAAISGGRGKVFELTLSEKGRNGKTYMRKGYFDDWPSVADVAAQATTQAKTKAVYVTLQELHPDVLHRAANRLDEGTQAVTAGDVTRWRNFVIDADPVRLRDISSTDAEKAAALERLQAVEEFLIHEMGWPDKAFEGDSGNGGHCAWRIDLPNTPDSQELMKRALYALAERFGDDTVSIDTSLAKPGQLIKLYGTKARKGDDTEARPHRWSKLEFVNEEPELVTLAQLEALAALYAPETPQDKPQDAKRLYWKAQTPEAVEGWAEGHNIALGKRETSEHPNTGKGYKWRLDCLTSDAHTDGAALFLNGTGYLKYRCHHDSCSDKTEADILQQYPARQAQSKQAKPQPDNTPFVERSDLATAEFAHVLYGHELIYTTTHGWLRNVSTHWTTDKAEAHAQKRMNDALRKQAESALARGDTELLKRSIPDARNTRAALYQFRSLVTTSAGDLDAEPHLLNARNGVIDLRTGELVAHEPSNRFTYCLDAAYRPGAHIETRPLYSEKMVEWFNGNDETIAFFERVLGYAISGETKEEIAVWLQGKRRSGKGSLLNTVLDLLGEPLGKTLSMRALTNERGDPQGFAIAPLRPSRFVVASESKKNQKIDASLLKWVTGRDTIQVAHKGKDPFQFRPQFKLFVMSNFLPSVDAGDDAVQGRIKVVKMPNSYYGNEDKDLKDALLRTEQKELLLALLVAQAGYYYKLGLDVPDAIEATADEVRQANNPTYQWMGESVKRKPGSSEKLDIWYQSYCEWCNEWGFEPQVKGWFARTLADAGYETKREWDAGAKRRVARVHDGGLDE